LLGDGVAGAGGGDETLAIDDAEVAAAELDGAGAFEDARGPGDGGAAGAEHVGEELLGEIDPVGADAVLDHEKPAGEALFGEVQTMAGGDLPKAGGLALDELEQPGANGGRACEERGEMREPDADGGTFQLHDAPG